MATLPEATQARSTTYVCFDSIIHLKGIGKTEGKKGEGSDAATQSGLV